MKSFSPLLLVLLLCASAAAYGPGCPACNPDILAETPSLKPSMPWKILVYSRTEGYRHKSIDAGIAAYRELGKEHGFEVTATEDPATFTDEKLARFAVIVFLNTTGDVLNDEQQAAMQRFIQNGGGFVGVHSATDTEYNWPWYGRLVGAYFDGHPKVQAATIRVNDPAHPSTAHLPEDGQWKRTDEWYNFRDVQPDLTILLRLDESTYEGGKMGDDHPIAWCHEFDGGRSWYTGGGHTAESFTTDKAFRQHLLGGLLWAAGRADASD